MGKKHTSYRALYILPLVTVVLGGCSSPTRDDVPGTVPYGSVEQVAQRTSGQGEINTIDRLGVLPLAEWPKPKIPEDEAIRKSSWWLAEQVSRDGLAKRDGVWLHIFVDEKPRWRGVMEDYQSIADITDLAQGPGGLTFATSAVPDQLTQGIQRFGRTYRLPYTKPMIVPSTSSGPTTVPASSRSAPPIQTPPPTSTAPSRTP
jgi:hypothetical protein